MTTPAALENPVVAPPRDTPDEQGFLTKLGSAFAMFRNGKSIAGLVILGVFILVAIFADFIAPASPTAVDPKARLQPPSAEHWLGTTHLGEDVFSQVIFGTRGVIVVGFLAAAIATVIAITVGVISGYISGWKSEALSALTNVFLVIPGLPLIIIVATMFEDPPLWVVAAVLGIIGWAWGARVLRAQTMSLRNRDFVQAARANGEPLRRIIAVEMLPNLMALIAASFVGTVTAAILSLTTLSYIGVIPVTTYNWGTISTGPPRRARSGRTSGGGTCPRACASPPSASRSRSSTSASTSTSTRACVRRVNVHGHCASRASMPTLQSRRSAPWA